MYCALYDVLQVKKGKSKSGSQDLSLTQGVQGEKVLPGIVLLFAQLSLFIGRSAIPRITEEIASSFSSGRARGYEYGPAFIPAVICCTFWVAGEKCLDHVWIFGSSFPLLVLAQKLSLSMCKIVTFV
nr:vacuolar protein sorting-associated protein 51 homolog [Coffea arabica]